MTVLFTGDCLERLSKDEEVGFSLNTSLIYEGESHSYFFPSMLATDHELQEKNSLILIFF